jgi:hypothetical protein
LNTRFCRGCDTSRKKKRKQLRGNRSNQRIHEGELTTTDRSKNVGDFYLIREAVFPVGNYRVDVYLNNRLEETCSFKVQ